jgi:hypothetical protein
MSEYQTVIYVRENTFRVTLRDSTLSIPASSRTGPQTVSDCSGKRCIIREVGGNMNRVEIARDIGVWLVG